MREHDPSFAHTEPWALDPRVHRDRNAAPGKLVREEDVVSRGDPDGAVGKAYGLALAEYAVAPDGAGEHGRQARGIDEPSEVIDVVDRRRSDELARDALPPLLLVACLSDRAWRAPCEKERPDVTEQRGASSWSRLRENEQRRRPLDEVARDSGQRDRDGMRPVGRKDKGHVFHDLYKEVAGLDDLLVRRRVGDRLHREALQRLVEDARLGVVAGTIMNGLLDSNGWEGNGTTVVWTWRCRYTY